MARIWENGEAWSLYKEGFLLVWARPKLSKYVVFEEHVTRVIQHVWELSLS